MQELFAIEVPDGPENADTTKPSCPEIPLSDEEWNEWSQPWRKTLVAKLLGKTVNFKSLETNIRHRWARKGSIKIVDMADGYYLVYFATEEDYNFALFEGPWMIADHYLIVQRWQSFFLQSTEISNKIAVWLRIPKLPLELYNAKFLWRIGTTLGTPLRIDRLTSIHSRGKYTRICVEIDLKIPLSSHIMIHGHQLPIEYEGLHQICFCCGLYGHKEDKCQEMLEQPDSAIVPTSANKMDNADGVSSAPVVVVNEG